MADYPPISFYFAVSFSDRETKGNLRHTFGKNHQATFQSVSGLSAEMQTENYREGGENLFEHILPVRARYSDLTLKRGLLKGSKLIKWCVDAFENLIVEPKDMTIILLDRNGKTHMTWSVVHVWPKQWSVSDLNAERSELAIESLELHYRYFTLVPKP